MAMAANPQKAVSGPGLAGPAPVPQIAGPVQDLPESLHRLQSVRMIGAER